MDTQQLIEKSQTQELTQEEKKYIAEATLADLESLRQSDPQKYLELIKTINQFYKEINSKLRKV